jgi:hypothetical protein
MIRNCFITVGSIKAKTNKIARLFYSFKWIDITKQRKMKKAGVVFMGWLATRSRLPDFSHKIARQWINYPYFL